MELNKVYNEDCLIGMQRIPDKSVDMILCDLPYGTTACKWDVIIPFEPLWKQYERMIKDNGAIVLTASQPFTSVLVNSNPRLFKYEWIWVKQKGSNVMQARISPLKIHESIVVFSKSTICATSINKIKYYPQGLMKDGRRYKSVMNSNGIHGNRQTKEMVLEFSNYPKSVLLFDNENGLHPTQKPVALFEYLIKTYTNEDEIVLDNCMGSGTTAIACINTNRNYIGFEKEEKYYNIIVDRIKKHTQQLKLIA